MRKYLIAILMVIIIATSIRAQNYAYVLNGLAETLSRIDLESGQVNNNIVTLGVVPNQVVYGNDMLYVVNSLSPSLMIIDPSNNSIAAQVFMPMNSNLWNVAVDENYAYVTGLATNSVYVVDLDTRSITDTLSTGTSPEGVLVHDNRLYVTNTGFNPIDFSYGQGSISVYDLSARTELSRINVGVNPQNLLVGPDGMINVICTGDYVSHSGIVYFIDPWDLLAVDSLSLGGQPTMALGNSAGKVYVAAGGWSSDGYIYSYDGNTHQALHTDANPIEVDLGVMGLAIDSLGNLYAACQMADHVDKITEDGTIGAAYSVGDGPSSIAIIDTRTAIDDPVNIPDKIALEPAYPNPFNGSTTLTIDGLIAGEANIEIFDVTGRLVNRLSINDLGTIKHSVTWSGTDCYGNDVASGVYFARMAGTSQARKLVMIR
jgi:YVTN family beta-propeller protein